MEVNEIATAETEAVNDVVKQQIRTMISTLYDVQKLRIGAGNRLTSQFYKTLGIEPSKSPENADKEIQSVLSLLKSEYDRITDGIAKNNVSLKKQISLLIQDEKNPLRAVRDTTDYSMIKSYVHLLDSEEELTKVLDTYVKQHPLWDAFFKDIKGCGTLMSAVCIAYLDPYKARHVSCFYRYAGLDTVQNMDEHGNRLYLAVNDGYRTVREKFKFIYQCDGSLYNGKVINGAEDVDGIPVYTTTSGEVLLKMPVMRIVDGNEEQVYEGLNEGESDYVGEVVTSEHGRRAGDTEMFEYVAKDGTTKLKRGITYNPTLKTKLMGVLSGCLIKAKDPVYSTIYYDYKKRLELSPKHASKSALQKNRMALRYMMKQFLRNLWVTWRTLEGLPVDNPYEVDKLGNKPHKYNEYQCLRASGVDKSYRSYATDVVS